MGPGKVGRTELITLVSLYTGVSQEVVKEVFYGLIEAIGDELAAGKDVVIAGLGAFHVTKTEGRSVDLKNGRKGVKRKMQLHQTLRVDFSKSRPLKAKLEKTHGKARSRRGS